MSDNNTITVFIADDHPMIRQALKLTVKTDPQVKIVGEADNGIDTIKLVKKLNPDIIILDIRLPDIDGIEIAKRLVREAPDSKIIALSMIDDENVIIEMIEAGATGYLLKDVFTEEVVLAIKEVYDNKTYLSKAVADTVNLMLNKNHCRTNKNIKPKLSEKEITVIKLICKEKSSKQIADYLGVTKKAVDGIRDNILKKLEVINTAGLVSYAIKRKIHDP